MPCGGRSETVLDIGASGIRDGECITNTPWASQNKGSVFRVKGEYLPSSNRVSELSHISIRDALNQIEFFRNKSLSERTEWLKSNSIDKEDVYLEDTAIRVQIIYLSGSFFEEKLPRETIDLLLRDKDKWWEIQDLYNMIPRKSGSKALKHTLIFRPSNWRVLTEETHTGNYSGSYFDLSDWKVKLGSIDSPLYIFQTNGESFAIANNTDTRVANWELIKKSIKDRFLVSDLGIENIRTTIEFFPPSMYKSLIQKLIRTRAAYVKHNNKLFDARHVLLVATGQLLIHPGSFVPNIQRFVSGIESAFKRAAVSICEDSYVDNIDDLVGLLALALLSQRNRNYVPRVSEMEKLFDILLASQFDERQFDYRVVLNSEGQVWPGDDERSIIEADNISDSIRYLPILLSEIKSFESDIKMVESIARNKGRYRLDSRLNRVNRKGEVFQILPKDRHKLDSNRARLVMPLHHCLDHHSYTEIGLFMSPYWSSSDNKSFGDIFSKIWSSTVGINSRSERREVDPEIDLAQRRMWKIKSKEKKGEYPVVPDKYYSHEYTLDISWIAGLIGPIEVKLGNSSVLVVIQYNTSFSDLQFNAIRRPARDKKPALTEDEKELAIQKAKIMLRGGVDLKHVPDTLAQFKGTKAYLSEGGDDFIITKGRSEDEVGKWSDLVRIKYKFPIVANKDISIDSALSFTGVGVIENADKEFSLLLKQTTPNILRRALNYLSDTLSVIELNKISRDGSGVDLAVSVGDISVTEWFCHVCCIYPAAIERIECGYKIKHGPLWWSIRDKTIEHSTKNCSKGSNGWEIHSMNDKRKIWEHQKSSIESMIERRKSEKKGNIIWIPPGLGKTAIVLSFVKHLINTGQMSRYCVYTLPPSALDSIKTELELVGLPYQFVDGRKGKSNKIEPHVVNIVLHDHMRRSGIDNELKKISSELFFIVDEFHKTMNNTIRTSIALETARLSRDFVAMSGSIISNEHLDPLVPWVSQLVEFQVTPGNVFVAIGSVIGRKVQTRVEVERIEIDAEIRDPTYYSVVTPMLGGKADRVDFIKAVQLSNEAIFRETIEQIVSYLSINEKVFVCVKNVASQQRLEKELLKRGINRVVLIDGKTKKGGGSDVIITTISHVEGYSIIDRRVAIQPVVFSSLPSREQRDARLNRINQPSPWIKLVNIHAGIISYIYSRYEKSRNLSETLREFGVNVKINDLSM